MAKGTPKYCGLRLPDGSIPASPFSSAQMEESWVMNNETFYMYLWRLFEIAISVFEWRNLPEGVDARMLEWWLLKNGYCVFFYDEDLKSDSRAPEGYAVLQAMLSGNWDIYNYPTDRRAYAVNGLNIPLDETNSVILFNNYLRVPMQPTLELYAKRLAEIDRTIDVNVINQKTSRVIPVDERQRLTVSNIDMQIKGNVSTIQVDKGFDVNKLEALDLTAPYVADKLNALKHQYWNEALTFLGVENTNTDKKERLISDEVMSNMGDVEAQRFTRLNARKQACEEINKLFGLEVDCDFRSGIYIRTDREGTIPTSGMMESPDAENIDNTGYSESGGIKNALRRWLLNE